MKTLYACIGVLAASNFVAFGQAPAFDLDHFKCYFPDEVSQIQPAQVLLQDQFGQNAAVVGPIFRWRNPTLKVHAGVVTPITRPDDHLTLHLTGPQPLIPRQVKIRNQFGERVIITQDAKVLAVPTQKDPHGPPKDVNHFSCYAVSNGALIDMPVGLVDQFFGSQHRVGRPVLFCNPVQKTHNGVVTPITNQKDHLTCYAMRPVNFNKTVDLHNQFGDAHFASARADMLCVPTEKVNWRVID